MIVRRLTVNLTPKAALALERHTEEEALSSAAVVNRALIFYATVMAKMAAEGADEITIGDKTIGVFL